MRKVTTGDGDGGFHATGAHWASQLSSSLVVIAFLPNSKAWRVKSRAAKTPSHARIECFSQISPSIDPRVETNITLLLPIRPSSYLHSVFDNSQRAEPVRDKLGSKFEQDIYYEYDDGGTFSFMEFLHLEPLHLPISCTTMMRHLCNAFDRIVRKIWSSSPHTLSRQQDS